jgi:hypothetical protein
MMLAAHFGERVAQRLQKVFVRGQDRAVQREFDDRLRAVQRGQRRRSRIPTDAEHSCFLSTCSAAMDSGAPAIVLKTASLW